MQTDNGRNFCLSGVRMDSNDNITMATIPHSTANSSPKKTWKDFSPPSSIRSEDGTTEMAESGNANRTTTLPHGEGVGGGGDDGGGGGGREERGGGGGPLDHKAQIADGPVIRMGMGAVTSRRDPARHGHPDSLPLKAQQGALATWKDVSPPKERKKLVDLSPKDKRVEADGTAEEKNRNPIRTNPFHGESGNSFRGQDGNFQSVKRIRTDSAPPACGEEEEEEVEEEHCDKEEVEETVAVETAGAVATTTTTWRDVSPNKGGERRKKRPESGYFSNDVQSEGGQESREEIDSSLSDDNSDSTRRDHDHSNSSGTTGGGEEGGCFHSSDYFYEDEFSVQFDTHLRETPTASAGGETTAQTTSGSLPLNGSYTKFRDSLLQTDLYLGPYESELSGSRTSMEISSSEREMMCSSDMLNFSKDPLFSPTPPPTEPPAQNVSVDSLSQQGGHGEEEMAGSRGSTGDPRLSGVHCGIRKDAYFLSFSGSQNRSTSDSDASYVSQDGQQGEGTRSDSSHGQDAEDEGSTSFHFRDNNVDDQDKGDEDKPPPSQSDSSPPPPPCPRQPVKNMLLSRYPGRVCLEALQDYLLSRSSSSKSAGSSRHSCSSHCKLSPLCGTLLSSGDLFMSAGHRRGLRRSSNLTTWKQVKSLKQLGRERNLHERASSLPDLTAEDVKVVRRDRAPRSVESLANSFHRKRHSAYLLELYQRMVLGSNPPSPTTLSLIDQVLFQEGFGNENSPPQVQDDGLQQQQQQQDDDDDDDDNSASCPSCGAPKRELHLDLQRDAPCGRSLASATTAISPHTVTLWYGQKNFSSQFPPNTAECGVQASLSDDSPPLNHRSMQTSPGSPGADILKVLHEIQAKETREARKGREKDRDRDGRSSLEAEARKSMEPDMTTRLSQEREVRISQELEARRPHEREVRASQERGCQEWEEARSVSGEAEPRPGLEARDGRNPYREKGPMTRAKSATECRDTHAERFKAQMRRTVSLSPSRIGMNSFYTHNSLPDLSFLSSRSLSKSRDSSSSGVSLFDPVQIPIILTPVVDDGSRSCNSQSRSSTSSGCACGKERNMSSYGNRYRRRSPGRSGEVTSSGSLSSSSGIELGYVEPRSLSGLAPELEHLLFFPPHLESAYNQLGLSENVRCCSQSNTECSNPDGGHRPEPSSPTKRCGSAKIERYANETHPCVVAAATGRMPAQRRNSGGGGGGGGSYTSCLNPDRLDALKEEKTPSPEPSYCHFPPRDYTDHRCFGCHDDDDEGSEEGESSQELDEEKFLAYQRWLQERKPPLKSCLRKQRCDRDHKARSLSLDYPPSGKPDSAPEKPPRRQNRHSIACDGMMPVLVSEEGFECHHGALPPCPAYPPPQFSPHAASSTLPLPYDGAEKVVMRKKKAAVAPSVVGGQGQGSVDGSVDESGRSKRVSFASEVSFHSPNYTPQGSPRRQSGEGEVTAMEMEEDVLTLHVVRRNRLSPPTLDAGGAADVKLATTTTTASPLGRSPVPPTTTADYSATCPLLPELSPLEQKASCVRAVMQASEALVQHFAQARDPFDKVRLGSAQETPVVGSLIVTSLCPAIERVVRDGMKSCLTGLHIFGKVQLSPWRVAESSAEIGPYTRAIHDLVKQLKVRSNLASHRQKFYAFLAGLLNLRLLDFWMGYISTKETLTSRFYDDVAIVRLSQSVLERQYQDMLLALQPLAVLPFQVDYDIVASYSLLDSAYMGESDIEPGPTPTPSNKQEATTTTTTAISSSPKIVIARGKSQAGKTTNRASWAGPSDSQEGSKGMDLSATWDWLKTTTLPKARSFMSDMGLMGSTSGPAPAPAPSTAAAPTPIPTPAPVPAPAPTTLGTSPVVKTSRLSQDLASVGIVSSRQNVSVTASSSAPDVPAMTSLEKPAKKEEAEEKPPRPRPESYPGQLSDSRQEEASVLNNVQQDLPAVVMDHGNKRKPEMSSARLKAEEILRRKGELCEKTSPQRGQRASRRPERADNRQNRRAGDWGEDMPPLGGQEVRGQPVPMTTEGSPRRRSESSPIKIQETPPRQSGSPQRALSSPCCQASSPGRGSPSRVSGSPNRGSPSRGSPNRLTGSPGRGPLINPGSPKSTVSGVREREVGEVTTVTISRRASRAAVEDFPEDDAVSDGQAPSLTPQQQPPQSVKKEERVCREGKAASPLNTSPTQQPSPSPSPSSPDVTAVSPTATSDPAGAPQSSQTQSQLPGSNANPATTTTTTSSAARSRLSGLKRLSPKGSFNIISFFDRLLLPSEKAATTTTTTTTAPASTTITKKEAAVSECDSEEQLSSVATATSSTTSSSAPSPTPPESLHTSSSASNNSSPRHSRIPTSQSRGALSRGSRIPKRQTDSPTGKTPGETTNPAGVGGGGKGGLGKTEKKKTTTTAATSSSNTTTTTTTTTGSATTIPTSTPTSTMRRNQKRTSPTPIPPTSRTTTTTTTTTPQVDINANSPEYQSGGEEMVVEHNPIGHWGCSSSETGQSDASGQSVSMEEDQSRCVLQQPHPARGMLGGKVPVVYK
ncbi:uncharacterized protein LOC143277640 [Babylonia areolata]|uniref:uncharacterized protein LOC143277640 n=1 Tax=Babylonia areolata TaxID=304850 RepID=UPI003FCF705D